VWANSEGFPYGVQAVKVFGQLLYSFPSTAAAEAAFNATALLRDALLANFASSTTANFAAAFPGTTVNCQAFISSASTAGSNATQTSSSFTGAAWQYGGAVDGASIDTAIGGVSLTPLQGALAQLITVIGPPDPLLTDDEDIDGPGLLGIDVRPVL
jgi:hypothetical protein